MNAARDRVPARDPVPGRRALDAIEAAPKSAPSAPPRPEAEVPGALPWLGALPKMAGGAKAGVKAAARARHIDYVMLLILLGLVLFGLVMVYSASYYAHQSKGENPFSTVLKQGIIAALGLIAMFVLMNIDYHVWGKPKVIGAGVVISLLLLGLVLIPGIGTRLNGSSRWIEIGGISIQPGEIAKVILVFYMARGLSVSRSDLDTLQGFSKRLIVVIVMFGLIMLQPNLSTAGSLVILAVCMLTAGGARWKHLGLLVAAGVAAAGLLTIFEPYRMARLMTFLDPFDPQELRGDGYQLYQSLLALGSGGLFGMGPGLSKQKALYLPYRDSDFIFSIFAEEYGWIGCVLLLAAYGWFVRQGIMTAIRCPDRFGSMLAAGLTMLIAVQVGINVAVVSGSMPTTGLPFPFFSAGGSNLLVYLAAMGVLLNITRSAPRAR